MKTNKNNNITEALSNNEFIYLYHGTSTKFRGKEFIMAPGDGAAYGYGVYFSYIYREAYTRNPYIVKVKVKKEFFNFISPIDKQWAKINGAIRVRLIAIYNRHGKRVYYCELLEVLPWPRAFLNKVRHSKYVTVRDFKKAKNLIDQPSKPNIFTWLLGKLLAICIVSVSIVKKDIRYRWLARFLFGIGGTVQVPRDVALEGIANNTIFQIIYRSYEKMIVQIRPDSSTKLFWLVGTFTCTFLRLEKESTRFRIVGKDVYDFHQQEGQGVQVQNVGRPTWAFSLEISDFEAHAFYILFKLFGRFIGAKYFKVDQKAKKAYPSNDLWNRLGGKPFVSIIDIVTDTKELFE